VRDCLNRHPLFLDLLVNEMLLGILVDLLGFNIKLLGSQIVKMERRSQGDPLAVNWHRDGGALSAELPDPLPPAFVKVGFCISGSKKPEGGELLVLPGSHCLIGDPVLERDSSWPLNFSRILISPGDLVIFDWRTWHAVVRNSSDVVRRTLYFTFGYRWLSPMDYQVMPEELLSRSPIHWQLLGGASELGNYLPSDDEVPLKAFCLNRSQQLPENQHRSNKRVVVDDLKERKAWRKRLLSLERRTSQRVMIARAIRDKTT
jgi:hypothetical protein